MFCPDCGFDARGNESACPLCGYPLRKLRDRLVSDAEASLGWAERIVGKPQYEAVVEVKEILLSFVTGEERSNKKDSEKELICERCGKKFELGSFCSYCGDRLPGLFQKDPYLYCVLRSPFQLLFSPRHFSINFPYPFKGGIVQPTLVTGVLAFILILIYPFGRIDEWIGRNDTFSPNFPFFISYSLICLIVIPVLVYLSAGSAHVIATFLSGRAQLRRTVRVMGAIFFWILTAGIMVNLCNLLIYDIHSESPLFNRTLTEFGLIHSASKPLWKTVTGIILIAPVWAYGWAIGGLYRLKWPFAVLHALITYIVISLTWAIVLVAIPLSVGGFI